MSADAEPAATATSLPPTPMSVDPASSDTTHNSAIAAATAQVESPTDVPSAAGAKHSPTTTATTTTTTVETVATTAASSDGGSETARLSGDALEQHCRNVEDELQRLRETELRLKQQNVDAKRREHILIRRLALKEQELQDYANQITEYKGAQVPTTTALRNALLDPAVNLLLQKLRAELQTTRARLEDTQNELSAWKFTPDSNTGKRLMAKCRLLYQENEELGRMTSNGRMAKLEGDLALQKSFSEEVKKSQSELEDFLQELDEDVEGMQSTILILQHELKTAKDTIGSLETELAPLRSKSSTDSAVTTTVSAQSNGDAAQSDALANGLDATPDAEATGPASTNVQPSHDSASEVPEVVDEVRTLRSGRTAFAESHHNGDETAMDSSSELDTATTTTTTTITTNTPTTTTTNNSTLNGVQMKMNGGKRTFAECEASHVNTVQVVSAKKIRRASVLSLDLNEEDSRIDCEDERTLLATPCNGAVSVATGCTEAAASPPEAVALPATGGHAV